MRVCLIAYDNDSYIHYFPLGLAYVAASLQKSGHEVQIYHQDVYRYPESHLTQFLTNNRFDVVGVGMCGGYYQYAKLKKISKAIEPVLSKTEYWIGGHLVSPEPQYFYEETGADRIFTGEYEKGVDIDEIPYPAWDLFPIGYYSLIRLPHSDNHSRCFPVLSGRGCPYRCNFCYRLSEGYRPRSIKAIREEIQILIKDYQINYIDFADELLMMNPDRTIEISEALKPLHIKWMCNGRLNCAKPKVLKAMKNSGCVFINYGIEAVDDEVLEKMNKKLTVKQITKGVEATLEAGISPGLNMLWGNIGDTKETLWKAVDFLLKYDDHAQLRTIRPVTPYPGCDLYYYAIQEGMLKGVEDFYENKHVNSDLASVQFTGLKDKEFHLELLKANTKLIDAYYSVKRGWSHWWAHQLYVERNTSFRGFRQT